jgi:hypothetical protein
MSAVFWSIDDLIGHLFGFVSDQQKITVMPLVNKICERLVKEPGSWKWGSDGFILRRPTLARLRLLRAVRAPIIRGFRNGLDDGTEWMLYHTAPDWLSCCPNVEVVTGSIKMDVYDDEMIGALARRLVEVDDYAARRDTMTALRLAGTPALRAMRVTYTRLDDIPPGLTDLKVDEAAGEIPMVARTLLRLSNRFNPVTWIGVMAASPAWNLRELEVLTRSDVNPGLMSCDRMVTLCGLCPHLVVLRTPRMRWWLNEVDPLARAAPLLEVLEIALYTVEWSTDKAAAVATTWWPRLQSVTVNGTNASLLLDQLSSPEALRYIDVTADREHIMRDDDVDADDVRAVDVIRAIIQTRALLTSLRINIFVLNNDYLDAMHNLLVVVGPTLSTLRAYSRIADVGRYCPRLRVFECGAMGRHVTNALAVDVFRGCPVLTRDWNTK